MQPGNQPCRLFNNITAIISVPGRSSFTLGEHIPIPIWFVLTEIDLIDNQYYICINETYQIKLTNTNTGVMHFG